MAARDLPAGIDTLASQSPALLRRLLRARDRMDAASQEAWPVRRLARVSGVSAAHFARAFKQAFGVPPHRYLLTRRIERASTLLRETDLPVTAIAFDTGWKSLGTFGRVFHDITGKSPGALRAQAQADSTPRSYVPACFLSAAHRPNLTTAVSEKRQRRAAGIKAPNSRSRSNDPKHPDDGTVRAGPGRGAGLLRRQARLPRERGRAQR